MSDACVVLFAKLPRPGRVKTRLIGDQVTAERAAELYGAFLRDMIRRFQSTAEFDLVVAWALGDDEGLPDHRGEAIRQHGNDLGERMYDALRYAARDHEYVMVLGSDHPELPRQRVLTAFNALRRGADAVLGPSRDGGYYLIGLPGRSLKRRLFEHIEWSTDQVLNQTLSRCRAERIEPILLEVESDIDRPEDLQALRRRLDEDESIAAETLAVLQSWHDREARR